MKRTIPGLMAILLTTTTALATPISTPLGCHDGTRNEPQAPTIIPAWVEVTPDIQHDGWIEDVPDIFHPEQVIKETVRTPKNRWDPNNPGACVLTLADGSHRRNLTLQADCLTPQVLHSMATELSTRSIKVTIIPESTEVIPDIDHPAYVEEVADIEHPEQVIPNPDLVIDTKTIKYKDVTFSTRPPFVIIDFHYETTDGSCH